MRMICEQIGRHGLFRCRWLIKLIKAIRVSKYKRSQQILKVFLHYTYMGQFEFAHTRTS
jgi:hypothetical protein